MSINTDELEALVAESEAAAQAPRKTAEVSFEQSKTAIARLSSLGKAFGQEQKKVAKKAEPKQLVAKAPVKTPVVVSDDVSPTVHCDDVVKILDLLQGRTVDLIVGDSKKKSLERFNNMINKINDAPKKVKQKLYNAISWIVNGPEGGTELSNYTIIAIKTMIRAKELDQSAIRDAFLSAGYKIGTANSQTGQMKHVLAILGICKVEDFHFSLNQNSIFAQKVMEQM